MSFFMSCGLRKYTNAEIAVSLHPDDRRQRIKDDVGATYIATNQGMTRPCFGINEKGVSDDCCRLCYECGKFTYLRIRRMVGIAPNYKRGRITAAIDQRSHEP
jgi:hypothetical protein